MNIEKMVEIFKEEVALREAESREKKALEDIKEVAKELQEEMENLGLKVNQEEFSKMLLLRVWKKGYFRGILTCNLSFELALNKFLKEAN